MTDRLDPPVELVTELAARWRLVVGPPLAHDGALSWVARVRRGDERLVLKLTAADDETRDEAAGLRAWNGDGVVRLVDAHVAGHVTALLLEDCLPGTPLSDRPPEEQDEVLAGLLHRIWIAPPGPPFRPLADMCSWWADEAAARGVPDEFADGLELFRTLATDAPLTCLLATDLHAGNVLAAGREPWLMIDPKPYAGDPHYDVTQHLLNNPQRLQDDPLRWVQRMAMLLDLDRDRSRQWMYARCVQESPAEPYLRDVARALR